MRYAIPLLLFLLFHSCKEQERQVFLQSEEYKTIHFVPWEAQPYERGFTHGKQLKEEITSQLDAWATAMFDELGLKKDSMYRIITKHSGLVAAIVKESPELLQEIEGIADGAAVDRNLLLCYNLGEEIYNYTTANFESCSTIAYRGDKVNLVAYNQDLPYFLHGQKRPVILRMKDHYVFTMPGCIALSGASGVLAVSCNSLPMLRMNPDGLPLSFALRKLLEKRSHKEAVDYIKNTPLAVPQNLLVLSGEEVVNFEISKNRISIKRTAPSTFFSHTNFPVENADFKTKGYQPSFCPRFHYLDSLITRFETGEEVQLNTSSGLESICAEKPILNVETFLRYVASYPGQPNEKAEILFINPSSKERVLLSF